VKLIIQPEDGLNPLLKAVRQARKTIDIVIFRFDRAELEKALEAAVARGVRVRACIAKTNRGGEKMLRKLEMRLLDAGVTVARTADDLQRYHGKMMIVDDELHVYGFNFTKLDIEKSRSFGIMTRDKRLVAAAAALFEADATRQPYVANNDRLVVSPETSRQLLTALIKSAKREIVIYDDKITDRMILRLLQERLKAGVTLRVIGKLDKKVVGAEVRKLTDLRMHVRAMVCDASHVFVGSQSMRKLQLEGRREIGVILNDSRLAKKVRATFESDWEHAAPKVVPPTDETDAKAKDEKAKDEKAEKAEKNGKNGKNGKKDEAPAKSASVA
jgi:phosphatidylserine/phosphatidylglycerophosphate/cardiolipin synthase-like enzyme